MPRIKKQSRFYKSFSGEYMGVSFEIERVRVGRKVEYRYRDNDVSSRCLNKYLYKNLIKNSELLYDDKKGRYVRYGGCLSRKTKIRMEKSK